MCNFYLPRYEYGKEVSPIQRKSKRTKTGKINMGRKITLSPKQQRDAVSKLQSEQGMSGYDPLMGMLPGGLGAFRMLNLLNKVYQPDPMPQRVKNFYDKYYGSFDSIPDEEFPTTGDLVRMYRANPSGAKKIYEDLVLGGFLGN